jgi:hypothetical protein
MYRYACLRETPNRFINADMISSLPAPSSNKDIAALVRLANSEFGDLFICHKNTTFYVICQVLFHLLVLFQLLLYGKTASNSKLAIVLVE